MRRLLRIGDVRKEGILAILDRAEELRRGAEPRLLRGKVLGLLFFQPSTRTRFGFAAAMARLDGAAVSLHETKFQPGMTGAESLEDTLRSIGGYCDAFVLRHPENDSIDRAAAVLAGVSLINAGNGTDEHPTQALIDLFAMRQWRGLEGLRIGLVGDLCRSRAAHSLLQALRFFAPSEVRLMHPDGGGPSAALLASWPPGVVRREAGLAIEGLDVLYVAGLLPGSEPPQYDELIRDRYRLTSERLDRVGDRCLILSPLPRIDEIDPGVDRLSGAAYFQQSEDGLFVRITLLEEALAGIGAGAGSRVVRVPRARRADTQRARRTLRLPAQQFSKSVLKNAMRSSSAGDSSESEGRCGPDTPWRHGSISQCRVTPRSPMRITANVALLS